MHLSRGLIDEAAFKGDHLFSPNKIRADRKFLHVTKAFLGAIVFDLECIESSCRERDAAHPDCSLAVQDILPLFFRCLLRLSRCSRLRTAWYDVLP
jgi:hypothetical protein